MTLSITGIAMPSAGFAYIIFFVTIILVIWQPWKLGIGYIAGLAALVALLTSIISRYDLQAAWFVVGNPLLNTIPIISIASLLDEAGFFAFLGRVMAVLGRGNSRSLFWLTILLASLSGIIFNSYSGVLICTPIVIETLRLLYLPYRANLAFLVATSWFVEVASLLLPGSNPVNLIISEYFDIPFLRYVLVMMPLEVVILTISVGVVWFYFERYLPLGYSLPKKAPLSSTIRDPVICNWGFFILGLLVVKLFFAKLSLPIAVWTAILILALAQRWFHADSPVISVTRSWRNPLWQVPIFSFGMYLLAVGLGNAGLIEFLRDLLRAFANWGIALTATSTASITALFSGLTHNLPVVRNNVLALHDAAIAERTIREATIYANLLGCTIGAKITPIGSLSTLFWWIILQEKGLNLGWSEYLKISIILVLPVLFIGLLFLSVWLPWLIA
ncbi:ArsB/NhaD family transporter [Oscillatoria salina]|uniref:ArsB/NhaD family transporter n=1 Tax=Oscillatoria salina TaxID=331517 RepID=UPI001CC936CE|nr:ArsB/NhaD family transporter [Oscillatoria salina]MBZ8182061.1 arsenical efflux pump membrane protein ArsB [Oscillatoria salina IIICB1]